MRTVRFQVEIDEDQMAELENLRLLGGLRTKKDLLNNALTLLKWAARKKATGCSIVCVSSTGSEVELEMPFLDAIAAGFADQSGARPTSRRGRPTPVDIARVG
jgi:hypothetical protein